MYRVSVLFFLSGFAGLVYQVVWSRMFQELFGVTVYAIATVLAVFLGGLGLGALVLGKVSDRRSSPLRFYGWLEIGIGATAIAGTLLLHSLGPLHLALANRLEGAPLGLLLTRFVLGCLVMFPATFLMGGTLPTLTRVLVAGLDGFGRKLSLVYALNTLGAVVGTLVSGFVLIRLVGLHPTLYLAAAVNLLVGLAALAWSPGFRAPESRSGAIHDDDGPAPFDEPVGRGLLAIMVLVGAVSLGLEILWTRILMLGLGTTTYAFVTMLASFLLGITLGSFLARSFIDRLEDVRRVFGWIQLGIAASVLATLPLASLAIARQWLGGWGDRWLALILLRFGVSLLVMLVPTTLIGMTFPLAGKLWTRRPRSVGRQIGQVYGASTVGNIVGAVIGSFWLLPALGLQKGVATLATLSLLAAAWGLSPSRTGGGRRAQALPVAAIAVVIVLLTIWSPSPYRSWEETATDRVLYYREGPVATVKVLQHGNEASQRSMSVDGITIGQSFGGIDMKQQALAHFPFLLMPNPPRELLTIGLGTGIVTGEAARHPSVERLDCVEISPSVVEGARFFDHFTEGVLDNPRVRVITDDGVNFLRRTGAHYDAVISDGKSRSAHAGNSVFLSRDYYALCRDRLQPHGLMIQWVPLELPTDELATILRSFVAVFPHAYVWVAPPHSCFLVGTRRPLLLDREHIDRVLRDPLTANLRRYGWTEAYGFAAQLTADRKSLAGWLAAAPTINTLERPVLEFYQPRSYAVAPFLRTAANLDRLHASASGATRDVSLTGMDPEQLERSRNAALDLLQALSILERGDAGRADAALRLLGRALADASDHGYLRTASLAAYARVVRHLPEAAEAHHGLARALEARGRHDEAAVSFAEALRLRPDDSVAAVHLGRLLIRAGRFDEALARFRQATSAWPDDPEALDGLAVVLLRHPDPARRAPREALGLSLRAAELSDRLRPDLLYTLGEAYAETGAIDSAVATASEALALATASGEQGLVIAIRDRLDSYR